MPRNRARKRTMPMVGVVADQALGDGAGQHVDRERSTAREVLQHRH
jgi:hypothetical protein